VAGRGIGRSSSFRLNGATSNFQTGAVASDSEVERMKRRWGWSAAVILLMTSTAQGQTSENNDASGGARVTRMDRSGDGKIGYEEFRNAMMRGFSAADHNGDGVLGGDEIAAHSLVAEQSESTPGEIKLDAYNDALPSVFDRFDADHDGSLAGDEVESLTQAHRSLKEAQP
jgi:Ca2+-binding EF-hand superfamily protein